MNIENKPLFSFIVTVYNAEKTIFRCLESIKNQTFKDFECIIVDDGSKDRSAAIIKKFLDDKRFQYHFQDNGGTSSSTNKALSFAKGHYIVIVDHDDFIDPFMLEEGSSIITLFSSPDIIQFEGRYVDENGQYLRGDVIESPYYIFNHDELKKEFAEHYYYYFIAHNCKMIKRTLFYGISYSGHGYGADTFVMHKICANVKTIYYCNKQMYSFTCLSSSISRSYVETKENVLENWNRAYDLLQYYHGINFKEKKFIGSKIIEKTYSESISKASVLTLKYFLRFRALLVINCRIMTWKKSKILIFAFFPLLIKFFRKIN